jgi:glycine cleavage system H protein
MNIPESLQYTKDHEWIKIDGKTALVGITEFAQGELGDIVYLDINTVGEDVTQHDVFGSVEARENGFGLYLCH